ncbi:ubiquitin-associated (UBA)/TS-N domain-containing protein [Rhynchospora pubera]|uniref:Ubiquitin-associated (UBA)/TS-N domain-containing protein n=1 Tax=Rhynchospora pubera TaxID=906938 RepID=A0AAV8DYW2_9POAL|nr:ubiquitin-associated (UBA)/TS-N domain-containing protein [Rhynchospora pubera]
MRELRKRLEMAELEVDTGLLKELELIGFPTNRATRALYYTGNCSLEAALNWVIEHENDSDIDQMLLVPVSINIEDGNQFSLPEELNLKAQKMRERYNRNAKKLEEPKTLQKLEEPKTLQTEVDKVTTAIGETTIKDPKNTEDERGRILEMLRTKREEERRTREMQLKEDQLERMRTNKELMEAKRQLEASQRKRSVEQAGLEKEEERKARERIRRRIEQDKAERRVKLGLPNEGPKAADPIVPSIIEKVGLPIEGPKAADPIVPPIIEKKEAEPFLVKSEQFKDCLRSFKRNHKDENAKVQRAFQTLLKIVGNIAKYPNEDKYRRIRLSNPIFSERVGIFEGAIEFLELCGFEKAEEGEEQYLLMPKDKINVQLLNSAGNEILSAMSNPYFGLLSK